MTNPTTPAGPAATGSAPAGGTSSANRSAAAKGSAPTTGSAPKSGDKPGNLAATTDITAGQGGVMTDEVGVITGDLTLRTELDGTDLTVHVQYKDADEWYKVTGAKTTLKDPADLAAVHKVAVGILNRPEG